MPIYRGRNVWVVMDPAPVVYAKVFHKGSGPDRDALRRARAVAALARKLAPKRTRLLANSIGVSQNRDELGRYTFGYKVYANAPYARYVHEGTGPSSRTPGGYMRFAGTNMFAGRRIVTKHVNHPGTPENPFLTKALIAMER